MKTYELWHSGLSQGLRFQQPQPRTEIPAASAKD